MQRRERWRKVLQSEVERVTALPWREIVAEYSEPNCHEVLMDGETYQVEIDVLESTAEELFVLISVDDGTLPQSMLPESQYLTLPKRA